MPMHCLLHFHHRTTPSATIRQTGLINKTKRSFQTASGFSDTSCVHRQLQQLLPFPIVPWSMLHSRPSPVHTHTHKRTMQITFQALHNYRRESRWLTTKREVLEFEGCQESAVFEYQLLRILDVRRNHLHFSCLLSSSFAFY